MHRSNYKAYHPKKEVIQKLKTFFEDNPYSLRILTLGATWCKTCSNVKPSLIKIVEAVDSENLEIFLLGGVKTTMESSEEDYSWSQRSPPEFHNPKFVVNQIPMVYFFNEEGQCLSRIEKYPDNGLSFEEAILEIAQQHLL
jgi:thiol-disulfide isomerase/thioredoxin